MAVSKTWVQTPTNWTVRSLHSRICTVMGFPQEWAELPYFFPPALSVCANLRLFKYTHMSCVLHSPTYIGLLQTESIFRFLFPKLKSYSSLVFSSFEIDLKYDFCYHVTHSIHFFFLLLALSLRGVAQVIQPPPCFEVDTMVMITTLVLGASSLTDRQKAFTSISWPPLYPQCSGEQSLRLEWIVLTLGTESPGWLGWRIERD